MKPLTRTREVSAEHLQELSGTACLYAILDACDEPRVSAKMRELGEEKAISLFKGGRLEDYWAVAPYLAQVDPGLLQWILEELDGEPWGILIFSRTGFQVLRQHLSRLLFVPLQDGRYWLFRFYDPRILLAYLPTCNEVGLNQFFGPVTAFGAPENQRITVVERKPELLSAPQPNALNQPGFNSTQPITIHEEQCEHLSDQAFEWRTVNYIRNRYPDRAAVCDVQRVVREGIRSGRSYGLINESSLVGFVSLGFILGHRFHLHPMVQAVLTDREIEHDQRLPMLLAALNSQDWEDVVAFSQRGGGR